jgi:hypothetical protein
MRISLIHVRLSSISQAVLPLPQLASMHRLSRQQLGMFNGILTDMLVDGISLADKSDFSNNHLAKLQRNYSKVLQ